MVTAPAPALQPWRPYAAGAVLLLALGELAAVLPGYQDGRASDLWLGLLVATMALPLAAVGHRPLSAAGCAVAAASVAGLRDYGGAVLGYVAVVVTVVAAMQRVPRRQAVALGAATAAAGAALNVKGSLGSASFADAVGPFLVNLSTIGLPLVLGLSLRQSRERRDLERANAEHLDRLQHLDAQAARSAERLSIARDVHDAVGHHLTAITVQASAGRTLTRTRPPPIRDLEATLDDIRRSAGEALRQTRLVVARTRRQSEGAPAGAPTLAEITALLADVRALGAEIELEEVGEPVAPSPIPEVVDQAAYRIVQEALTNVRRHARPPHARVRIERRTTQLRLSVIDDGAPVQGQVGAGHGLTGMRERAALLGGSLSAGPRPGGGWIVEVTLPYAPQT